MLIEEYKEYAIDGTLTLSNPSNIIYDEDLKNTLGVLNKAAGIDKEIAIKNISTDGKELIGSWRVKDDNGEISIRFIFTSDNKYSWYKR